jgi:acyl-coenzyme A thioesterase PaaI-like protein
MMDDRSPTAPIGGLANILDLEFITLSTVHAEATWHVQSRHLTRCRYTDLGLTCAVADLLISHALYVASNGCETAHAVSNNTHHFMSFGQCPIAVVADVIDKDRTEQTWQVTFTFHDATLARSRIRLRRGAFQPAAPASGL